MKDIASPTFGKDPLLVDGIETLPVYERLGIIVRALHSTLSEIGAQDVLIDAVKEFPSARERLLHIADLTESSANLVLCKVEEHVPLLDALSSKAGTLDASWAMVGDTSAAPDLAALAASTRAFLGDVQSGCGTTRLALSDIMMAQDFQDLTGQLIKKVVSVLERTENDLLKLLIDAAPSGTIAAAKGDEAMAGPGAPGSIALSQQSVDNMLADLGF